MPKSDPEIFCFLVDHNPGAPCFLFKASAENETQARKFIRVHAEHEGNEPPPDLLLVGQWEESCRGGEVWETYFHPAADNALKQILEWVLNTGTPDNVFRYADIEEESNDA